MSFFATCKTYHDYACDPRFDLLTAASLTALSPFIRGVIHQTFDALRMRKDMAPYLKELLTNEAFQPSVSDETDRFLQSAHLEFYHGAYHNVMEISKWPMNIVFENDNVLRYMIGNINFSMPLLTDVMKVCPTSKQLPCGG
jgi:hypothetical protein